MGLRFRKTYGKGPFRVTVSKSGVSYSAGVKGYRVTKRADGRVQRTASIPGTGISHIKTLRKPAQRAAAQTPPPVQRTFRPVVLLLHLVWFLTVGSALGIVLLLLAIVCSVIPGSFTHDAAHSLGRAAKRVVWP